MARTQNYRKWVLLMVLLAGSTLTVEKVTAVDNRESSRNGDNVHKGSVRSLLSYLPLDKIGGGIVLRELSEEDPIEKPSSSLNPPEIYASQNENDENRKVNNSTLPLTKNRAILKTNSEVKRHPREAGAQNSYNSKTNVDEIDGSSFRVTGKRNFDEIDRSGFRGMGKRNFDEIDTSGFRGMGKRNFDEIDRSGFRGMGKRNFNEIDRSGFRDMGKRNFDEIDGSGFRSMGKRNFDEIDRSGFSSMGKRHLDEIDRAGFSSMGKRNFDEIDGSGFRNMGKRNFDEIDRSGFRSLGKRNFDEIDRSGFRSMGKRNFDEIDRAGISSMGKRGFDEIDRAGFGFMGKRLLREIGKANVKSMSKRYIKRTIPSFPQELTKRNFDEIDRSGFHVIGKRNAKNRTTLRLQGITKNNTDHFDALNTIDKQVLHYLKKPEPIKALSNSITKRSVNKVYLTKFRNTYAKKNWVNNSGSVFKGNFDKSDPQGFHDIDKRKFKEPLQLRDPMGDELDASHDVGRSGSLYSTTNIGIHTLIKSNKPIRSDLKDR